MSSFSIDQTIDLDRYPIDRPDSPNLKDLLVTGRQALDESALFSLEGFVRPEIVPQMANELDGLVPKSCRDS